MFRLRRLMFAVLLTLLTIGLATATASAANPSPSASASSTSPSSAPGGLRAPTDGENRLAVLALLGAIALGWGVLRLVTQAHRFQRELAELATNQGQQLSSELGSSAGPAALASDALVIQGGNVVTVAVPATFSVDKELTDPTWSVAGTTAFAQSLKDPHTFVFTPQEVVSGAAVNVTAKKDGTELSGTKELTIVATEPAKPFVVRFAIAHWGLVLVAVVLAFGAVALALTGRLDGGNFVALVTALAALLGVTAAATSGSAGSSGSGATSSGSGNGSTSGTTSS
jgi:glucose/arabinose dehydrogenase